MYWNLENYYSSIGDEEKLKLWRQINCYRREILRRSNKVICSSESEKKLIQEEYGKNIKCEIVYTGFFNESDEIPLLNFKERYKIDDYVLAVGNISKRKNQLALAKATKELGIQLVLIGSGDKNYLKMCTENENVLYLGDMNSYFTYNAYKFAKVHAMPSFGEIPGLSSLAAAAYGCNVVCTTEGSSKEYFKDLAFYTSPFDKNEIKDTIYQAFNTPKNDKLKDFVRKNYSWRDTIQKIADIYATLFYV
nr:hypothetical glucose transferase GtfB [Clostridium cellulovorans]